MPRYMSAPGVYRQEFDISEILVATGISNGGIVIRAPKGPIKRPVLVSNDKEFIEYFGNPYYVSGTGTTGVNPLIPEYGYGSYGAIEFLKESTVLYVVRAFDDGDRYAACQNDTKLNAVYSDVILADGDGLSADASYDTFDTITSISTYDDVTNTQQLIVGYVSPGKDGTDYGYTIETLNPDADWLFNYDEYPTETSAISAGPDTIWTSATSGDIETYYPIASKVFKLNLFKKDTTEWTDLYANTSDKDASKIRVAPIESYYGTLSPIQDTDGNQLWMDEVINGNGKNIYVKSKVGGAFEYSYILTGNGDEGSSALSLVPNGTDSAGNFFYYDQLSQLSGGISTEDDGITGDSGFWDYFADRDEVPVQILINTSYDTVTKQALGSVLAKRYDAIGTNQVGDLADLSYTDVIASEAYGYVEPSYVGLYGGYSKIYDKYNDKFVYLPNSIYGASLYARGDNIANPWDAPAGIDRGTLAVFDQLKVYSQDHIGKLYEKNINSVKFLKGVGFAMWGQKTAQLKKSALSSVNVRRNLLYMENNVEVALLPFTFENNTEQTRLRAFTLVDTFLASVLAGGGLYDYDVVCDSTNNTSTVIDSGEINLDMYVQPTRTSEKILFNTIVTRTGVDFGSVRLKYS